MRSRIVLVAALLCACAIPSLAQAATRPVVLTWVASTSSGITGYSIYRCTVSGTTCTPNLNGTPLATVTGLTYTDSATTQTTYGYSVVANAPACTPTSPPTTACGNSPAAVLGAVPVPPQANAVSTFVIVVP